MDSLELPREIGAIFFFAPFFLIPFASFGSQKKRGEKRQQYFLLHFTGKNIALIYLEYIIFDISLRLTKKSHQ